MAKADIFLYSDPDTVFKRAKNWFGDDVQIKLSTRKNKKYMIFDPLLKQWVHFGEMGYQDYTKHLDDKRRKNFLLRNAKWNAEYIFSPGYLAYNLLW